jgi:hypothetical protein
MSDVFSKTSEVLRTLTALVDEYEQTKDDDLRRGETKAYIARFVLDNAPFILAAMAGPTPAVLAAALTKVIKEKGSIFDGRTASSIELWLNTGADPERQPGLVRDMSVAIKEAMTGGTTDEELDNLARLVYVAWCGEKTKLGPWESLSYDKKHPWYHLVKITKEALLKKG